MMGSKPFIIKDNQEIPDSYSITVDFIDGKSETFEVAFHSLRERFLEVATHDDKWMWLITENIKKLSFDKRFSKMLELQAKEKENDPIPS